MKNGWILSIIIFIICVMGIIGWFIGGYVGMAMFGMAIIAASISNVKRVLDVERERK